MLCPFLNSRIVMAGMKPVSGQPGSPLCLSQKNKQTSITNTKPKTNNKTQDPKTRKLYLRYITGKQNDHDAAAAFISYRTVHIILKQ